MIAANAIASVLRFFRAALPHRKRTATLVLAGSSGLLETLPILASLPLIRALFLGEEHIQWMGFAAGLRPYTLGLIFLLISRFALGSLNHWYASNTRARLLANYRIQHSEASKLDIQQEQKRIQSLHFLVNGTAQLVPGIVFTLAGAWLLPLLGAIIIGIVLFWWLPLRWLKQRQDWAHDQLSKVMSIEPKDAAYWERWNTHKSNAGLWDSLNKNSREFVVLSTLVVALLVAQHQQILQASGSFIAVFMFLRGLQHLFNAYIMSQQISALKSYFTENLQN